MSEAPGLEFHICKTRDDVIDAWHLLYSVYLKRKYISPNPYEVHTSPCAMGFHTAIIMARIAQVPIGTIAAINDSPLGLPMDSVYPDEIKSLRDHGRKLVEVGLLAEKNDDKSSLNNILGLMNFTYHYSRYSDRTDIICGIPPRRAKLYCHAFGFEPLGKPTLYEKSEEKPVILMRVDINKACSNRATHRGLDYFMRTGFDYSVFDSRFSFSQEDMSGSILEQYIASGLCKPDVTPEDIRKKSSEEK